jgi:hypothetical protein
MANIPALPSGQAILARGKAKDGSVHPYGPGTTKVKVEAGSAILMDGAGVELTGTLADGTYTIALDSLTPESVPYVNRFIADWAFIKRDWRSKTYKVQSAVTGALSASVEAPERVSAPTMAPTTAVEAEAAPFVDATVEVAPVFAPTPVVGAAAIIPEVQKLIKPKHRTISGVEVTTMGRVTIPTTDYDILVDAWSMRQNGEVASVIITGPSGTAKTLMVKSFAATLGVPFIKVDGGSIRTADDWFGALRQDPASKTWSYVLSPFGHALKHGIKAVVLLDEANRAETPQALNAALGLLDETGTVYIPDARENLSLPDGLLVVVTANKGAEYVGTVPFDAAVLQRFALGVALDYPVANVEVEVLVEVTGIDKATAKTLVAMANHQRPLREDLTQFPSGTGISTRMLVDISRRVVSRGTNIRLAVDSNFAGQFDAADRGALSIIVDTYFPRAANDTLDVDVTAIQEDEDL